MAIKDFVLAGLIFSAQFSEAAVIGPRKHWLHERSITNTTTSQDPDTATDPSTSPTPSSSDSEATGAKSTGSSKSVSLSESVHSSESAGSSSGVDDSTSADHATPDLPTGSPCTEDGDASCEDGHNDDEKPGDDEDNPDNEDPGPDEDPNDDNTPGDGQEPGDDEDDEDNGETGDDEQPSDASTGTSLVTNEDGEVCTPLDEGEVVTVYSVIYTETLTWTDNPDDYTAPYPSMEMPTYCEPTTTSSSSSSSVVTPTPKLTSVPGPDDGWNTYCATQTNGTTSCTSEPVFNPSFIFTTRPIRLTSPLIGPPGGTSDPVTSTFFITSKNPSVVFPPSKTPDYGQDSDDDPPHNPGNGNYPAETHPPSRPRPRPPQSPVEANPPDVTITADPTQVIIGDYTLSNLKPGETTKVTVGGNEYEINPSQIVQAGGKTVNRPGAGQALAVADPIETIIDGVAITISGSRAVIGGHTYTIGSTPSTEIVQGRTVVISPTGITFKGTDEGVSYEATPPEQTGIIVAGGEMMTAIGHSVLVIHETTITYGPGISPQTETIDDDTIVVDEHGIAVHGSTVGGDALAGDETRYDVVGGATLTRVGPSKMVIRDVTYTVGPDTGTTTTFVGGEDITIAPDGVTVDTLTVPYPFGPTVVTAIPAPKTTDPPSQETDDDEEDEDGTRVLRPGWVAICIAIGAWLLL